VTPVEAQVPAERGAEGAALGEVRHRYLDLADVRIHVAEAGSGEPLVLLHTSLEHWETWRGLIPALAQHYRVICPDMRGCGWSGAPRSGYEKESLADDVVGTLDALGIERAGLVGHGMGGLIGFLVAQRVPERVSRYLAIGIVPPWPRVDLAFLGGLWRSWYQPVLATPALGPCLLRWRPFLHWHWRGTSPRPELWTEDSIAPYLPFLREPARARAVCSLYRTFLLRELLPLLRGRYRRPRLEVPTLLLFGTEERFFSQRALREVESFADELTVELLEGEGHFVHEERPELIAARAERFFGKGG
jgi:pimeloyl-ACP methyl ester carboxylesterase